MTSRLGYRAGMSSSKALSPHLSRMAALPGEERESGMSENPNTERQSSNVRGTAIRTSRFFSMSSAPPFWCERSRFFTSHGLGALRSLSVKVQLLPGAAADTRTPLLSSKRRDCAVGPRTERIFESFDFTSALMAGTSIASVWSDWVLRLADFTTLSRSSCVTITLAHLKLDKNLSHLENLEWAA